MKKSILYTYVLIMYNYLKITALIAAWLNWICCKKKCVCGL